MASNVVLIFIDLHPAPLLKQTFQRQQLHRLQTIRLNELFDHLSSIKQQNLYYKPVDYMSKYETRVYVTPQVPITLNTETISMMEGMNKDLPMTRQSLSWYPKDHKQTMKKLEKLCENVGKLQAFRYHKYQDSHIGIGFEYEINAFGIDGVFLLVFHSEGDW